MGKEVATDRIRRRSRFPLLRHIVFLFKISDDRIIEVAVIVSRRKTFARIMEFKGPESDWSIVDYGPVRVGIRLFG